MPRLSGYETYVLHMALKNHFTTKSYDYFKYNKKVKVSKESFLERKDRLMYERLSRKYNEDEMEQFLISNFMNGKKWIGEFLEDDSQDIYTQYKKRSQALPHYFREELESIVEENNPAKIFKVVSNEYPRVVSSVMSGEISLETFIILDKFIQFEKKYDKYYGDDLIWNKIKFLKNKASPFILFDMKKIKSVMTDIFLDRK